jgi:hypothetical protein
MVARVDPHELFEHQPTFLVASYRPPGSGVESPLSARFGYASASGRGRSLGRATLVIETGSIHGGRSQSTQPPRNSTTPGTGSDSAL